MSIASGRIASSLLVIALVAACDGGPSAPDVSPTRAPAPLASVTGQGVDRSVREGFYDLEGALVQFPCGPDGAYTEQVQMFGRIFFREVTTFNEAGRAHVTGHTMPVGLGGVGLTSGAIYRVSEREHLVSNVAADGGSNSYRMQLKISAPDIGLRGRLVLDSHVIYNAHGEIVVERSSIRGECRA